MQKVNSEYVEGLILRMCKQPRSFEYISRNLFGLDPIELSSFLNIFKGEGKLLQVNDLWVVSSHYAAHSKASNIASSLGNEFLNQHIGFFNLYNKPHPLDFEWRNATVTIEYLTNLLLKTTKSNDRVLLLGMPTLFANICDRHIPNKVTLVDFNQPIVHELRKRIHDERFDIVEADIFLLNPEKLKTYSLVLMDPPWYSPHFFQFVWLASICLEIGGTLGISLPPINTRPKIEEERLNWFRFCLDQGLALDNLYSQQLQYAMPFFEYNAYKAADLNNVLPIWRKGDFALLRKIATNISERPKLETIPNDWSEVEIEGVRIRVKRQESSDEPSLKVSSVIEGNILPSVSTRDKRRLLANVWTSGNRIFHVNNSSNFYNLLKNYKAKKTIGNNLIIDFIKEIVDNEKAEYESYLKWLYNEMERQID